MATDLWCVLLTGLSEKPEPDTEPYLRIPANLHLDPIDAAMQRACRATARNRIAAVVSSSVANGDHASRRVVSEHVFVQPSYRGTAYEVLVALLELESLVDEHTPVLFMPVDHVVRDERIMAQALRKMGECIAQDPSLVYLLGTVPEGPHNQLGYIVPWYDAQDIPTAVYAFVEGPSTRRARQLINSGALWNTFIFGGTVRTLMQLYVGHLNAALNSIRGARARGGSLPGNSALAQVYGRLPYRDFSRDVLIPNVGKLSLLRLPGCGWWPLKGPLHSAMDAALDAQEHGALHASR